jgi:hypothetical protein
MLVTFGATGHQEMMAIFTEEMKCMKINIVILNNVLLKILTALIDGKWECLIWKIICSIVECVLMVIVCD